MGTIKLGIAPFGHECDCCQSANYRRSGFKGPQYPCVIYTLTIGAGYRQPSYLCPNCLGVLRVTLGVKNMRTTYEAATGATVADYIAPNGPPLFRVLSDTAPCNMEGE